MAKRGEVPEAVRNAARLNYEAGRQAALTEAGMQPEWRMITRDGLHVRVGPLPGHPDAADLAYARKHGMPVQTRMVTTWEQVAD